MASTENELNNNVLYVMFVITPQPSTCTIIVPQLQCCNHCCEQNDNNWNQKAPTFPEHTGSPDSTMENKSNTMTLYNFNISCTGFRAFLFVTVK